MLIYLGILTITYFPVDTFYKVHHKLFNISSLNSFQQSIHQTDSLISVFGALENRLNFLVNQYCWLFENLTIQMK